MGAGARATAGRRRPRRCSHRGGGGVANLRQPVSDSYSASPTGYRPRLAGDGAAHRSERHASRSSGEDHHRRPGKTVQHPAATRRRLAPVDEWRRADRLADAARPSHGLSGLRTGRGHGSAVVADRGRHRNQRRFATIRGGGWSDVAGAEGRALGRSGCDGRGLRADHWPGPTGPDPHAPARRAAHRRPGIVGRGPRPAAAAARAVGRRVGVRRLWRPDTRQP